jgi:peptide/nickel transport system substrate-binding protein
MVLSRRQLLWSVATLLVGSACTPAAAPPGKPAEPKPADAKPAAPAATSAPAAAPAKPAESKPAAAAQPTAASKPDAKPATGTPRSGGELSFVVSAEPPSFDAHRETTFAMLHPTAPHYSLLVKFNPDKFPEVIPDMAESWDVSADNLSYTFKLRDGVKFHDGSPCASADVVATYEKIIKPPDGVVSARKASYGMVESVTAPDPRTVTFKLKYVSASFLNLVASPWNYIYSAAKLAADPKWYEKNVMGTGPFTYVEYVPGSHWVGKKFPDYFEKGKPYLDGFRATFIKEPAAQVAAIRGGRAAVEFRGFTPQQRDDLVNALGNKVTVQESPWITVLISTFNTEKKPFDDPRVRRALTMAIDRWGSVEALSKITFVKPVGGLLRPGSPYARPDAELEKVAGFSKDINGQRDEAKKLLREAGVPDGFSFTLKNRDTPNPYETIGVFLIDQWRRIGLNVTHQQSETNQYLTDHRNGAFDVSLDFLADFVDEPDLQLSKFLSATRSPTNYGRYNDPQVDELYDQQSREPNPEKRKQLVWKLEDLLLTEKAYVFPVIWWQRIIPHLSTLQGYKVLPSHYVNQDLTGVWLSE